MTERSRETRKQSYNELKSGNDRRSNEILSDEEIKQELKTPNEVNEPKVGVRRARKLALKEPKHENVEYKKALQTGLQGSHKPKMVEEVVKADNMKELRRKAEIIAKDNNQRPGVVLRTLVETEYVPAETEMVETYPVNRASNRSNETSRMISKLAHKVAKTKANKVKTRFPNAPTEAIIETADRGYHGTVLSMTAMINAQQEEQNEKGTATSNDNS